MLHQLWQPQKQAVQMLRWKAIIHRRNIPASLHLGDLGNDLHENRDRACNMPPHSYTLYLPNNKLTSLLLLSFSPTAFVLFISFPTKRRAALFISTIISAIVTKNHTHGPCTHISCFTRKAPMLPGISQRFKTASWKKLHFIFTSLPSTLKHAIAIGFIGSKIFRSPSTAQTNFLSA